MLFYGSCKRETLNWVGLEPMISPGIDCIQTLSWPEGWKNGLMSSELCYTQPDLPVLILHMIAYLTVVTVHKNRRVFDICLSRCHSKFCSFTVHKNVFAYGLENKSTCQQILYYYNIKRLPLIFWYSDPIIKASYAKLKVTIY